MVFGCCIGTVEGGGLVVGVLYRTVFRLDMAFVLDETKEPKHKMTLEDRRS